MKCPELTQLLDLMRRESPRNAEMRAHVAMCDSCREDLQLLRDIRAAMLGEGIVVPPDLNERALQRVRAEARREAVASTWGPGKRWAVASSLGAMTTASAMWVVGTIGQGNLVVSAAVVLGAGAVIGWGDLRRPALTDGGDAFGV